MNDEELPAPPGQVARRVHAVAARRRYRCPGCANPIPAGVGHVVAWPAGLADHRRHWHHHCWRLEVTRSERRR